MSVFIIAEAGVNHNGSLPLAKKLIDAACAAGADAVKFQTFKAENIVSKYAAKAEYQKQTTGSDESQYEMIKRLELNYKDHRELISYCQDNNILFLSSPFDEESIDLLHGLGLDIFKIPSGEITNLPYLRKIGQLNKKVILSTGMAAMNEIDDAIHILTDSGTYRANITLLHATTEYPCPMGEVNLKAMQHMARTFQLETGYSDHTQGIEVPIAAAALGASVIEKHFTLDRNMDGPDHRASLEPPELKAMVKAIRNIEQALGDGRKQPAQIELKNLEIVRKSIVAKTRIKKGEIFSSENISTKRPGGGISPMRWDSVIGQRAQKDYEADDFI